MRCVLFACGDMGPPGPGHVVPASAVTCAVMILTPFNGPERLQGHIPTSIKLQLQACFP